MAENSDGQERSEEPTGKRLEDARQKGQVPRSRELTTLAGLLVAATVFLMAGEGIVESLLDIMRSRFILTREDLSNVANLPVYFLDSVTQALLGLVPFLVAMVVAAIISNVALSGWNFTASAIAIKLDKLDPIKGLKRVFGWRGVVELFKGMAKFFLVGTAAIGLLIIQQNEFLGLGGEPLDQALAHTADLLLWAFLILSSALIVVVLIDVPFQMWDHKRQLKMTKQEVKEERKQTDGSPEVKRRQRQIQFDAAQRRMMESVPEADVVVTNPTHYAVALRYEQDGMDAPVVVAKGSDMLALKIRNIAQENDVPVLSAPPLARAIFYSTELDQPIPAGLYRAVAQVLAYVFHLKNGPVYNREARTPQLNVEELPIPDDLRHDPD